MPEETDRVYNPTATLARVGEKLRTGIVPAPGVSTLSVLDMKQRGNKYLPISVVGKMLRDSWWQKFPLLPALVSSFMQIATSREWTVTGEPRRAARAVERLNTTVYVDTYGQLYEGWSAFAARRVIDWLMLGVNGMIVPNKVSPVQYIDPLEVQFIPQENRPRVLTGKGIPKWEDYYYQEDYWDNTQIFFNHYMPYGSLGAIMAPLVPVIPLARLLYLVQQHDQASVDGRRIKDIFVVADDNIRDALEQALHDYIAMYSGEDPEKHGIPMVALNKRGGFAEGEKVEDHIGLLGISNIPESLDREYLYDYAAIEFSALTGMQVTEWYHIKSGATNRATERVNQERGRTKGPNYFCRQDQRFINNSKILNRTHFAYVEEVDIQAQKDKAEVMLRLSEAIKNLNDSVGVALSPRSLVRWLQHLGVFPTDDYLIDDIMQLTEDPTKPQDMVDDDLETLLEQQERRDRERQVEREMEDAQLAADKQRLLIAAQAEAGGSAQSQDEQNAQRSILRFIQEVEYARSLEVRPLPEYGDVTVNSDGLIVDRRVSIYPVAKLVEQVVKDELTTEYAEPDLDAVVAKWAETLEQS